MNMRLIGASKVSDLTPAMVDARGLTGPHGHVQTVRQDTLGLNVYDSLSGPKESVQKDVQQKSVKAKL